MSSDHVIAAIDAAIHDHTVSPDAMRSAPDGVPERRPWFYDPNLVRNPRSGMSYSHGWGMYSFVIDIDGSVHSFEDPISASRFSANQVDLALNETGWIYSHPHTGPHDPNRVLREIAAKRRIVSTEEAP